MLRLEFFYNALNLNPVFVQHIILIFLKQKSNVAALKPQQLIGNAEKPRWQQISYRYLVVDKIFARIPTALLAQHLQA